jgi:two-component system response regulator ResD
MQKILVVDDDENIVELISLYLRKEGFTVIAARDGGEALRKIAEQDPDLVLLDIMMPVKDGWEVCREIRQHYRAAVIMLTARGEAYDKILGLELGADDYITKPFNPRELVARVKAVLRRSRRKNEGGRQLHYRDLIIDLDEFAVSREGRPLSLTRKELELLWLLAGEPNRVFSREQLLSRIWGYDYTGDTRTVDTHIKRLRRKLGAGEGWRIGTVWGVGYKFEVERE